MTREAFWSLVRQTLFQPRAAAQRILALGLSAREGWAALGLMSVLNTIAYTVSVRLVPPGDPAMMDVMGPAFHAPLVFAAVLYAALALTALAFTHVGRFLGGQGSLADIVVLMTWMQVLRLMVQVVLLVLALSVPALAAFVVLASAIWGFYILLAFVAEVHRFDTLWRAAGAVIMAMLTLVFGLSLLLSLAGVRMAGGM